MHHPHIVQNVTMALAEDVATGGLSKTPDVSVGLPRSCGRR